MDRRGGGSARASRPAGFECEDARASRSDPPVPTPVPASSRQFPPAFQEQPWRAPAPHPPTLSTSSFSAPAVAATRPRLGRPSSACPSSWRSETCLLYTSDAADEEDSVDLGGRRIIKK